MKSPRMAATIFAMGLTIASASMHASAASPSEADGDRAVQIGMGVTNVFDGPRAGQSSRNPLIPAPPSLIGFPYSSRLLVTGHGARDPVAMTIACLGLMAMIAYRRLVP